MTTQDDFFRAVGNAAQEADKLRAAVNAGVTGKELETRVACFVLAAAQVRNRFEDYEDDAEAWADEIAGREQREYDCE